MSWQIQLLILIQFLPIPNPFHSKFFPCNWSIFRKIRQIACLARHFRCASNGKLLHYFNSPTFYGGWKHYLHRFHRNYEQCTFAAGPHAQFLAFLAFPAHFRRISGTFRQQYNSYWAFIEAFSCRICLSSKKIERLLALSARKQHHSCQTRDFRHSGTLRSLDRARKFLNFFETAFTG